MIRIGVVRETTGIDVQFIDALGELGLEGVEYDLSRHSEWLRFKASPPAALIWWAKHNPGLKARARQLLYHVNVTCGIPTFPVWNDFRHYDDKIAQYYLLSHLGLPHPETFVTWNREEAMAQAAATDYPVVSKASSGAGSSNVMLLKNRRQAERLVRQVFGRGRKTYFRGQLQRNYLLWQKFLPGNNGDWRVVCLGDSSTFGFFRHNREGSWQASGSGVIERGDLPSAVLEGSWQATRALKAQVMSYDWLKDEEENWMIAETSTIWGDPGNHSKPYYMQSPVYTHATEGWQSEIVDASIPTRLVSYLVKTVWQLI